MYDNRNTYKDICYMWTESNMNNGYIIRYNIMIEYSLYICDTENSFIMST